MAIPGSVEDLSRKDLREQFEVNVFGLQELTNAIIPTFRNQGWGRIVNISSIYGVVTALMVGGIAHLNTHLRLFRMRREWILVQAEFP